MEKECLPKTCLISVIQNTRGILETLQKKQTRNLTKTRAKDINTVKDQQMAKRSWEDILGHSHHMSRGNTDERAVSYQFAPVGTANPRTGSRQKAAWQWSMGLPCTVEKLKQAAWGKTGSILKTTPALPDGPAIASFGVNLKRL